MAWVSSTGIFVGMMLAVGAIWFGLAILISKLCESPWAQKVFKSPAFVQQPSDKSIEALKLGLTNALSRIEELEKQMRDVRLGISRRRDAMPMSNPSRGFTSWRNSAETFLAQEKPNARDSQ